MWHGRSKVRAHHAPTPRPPLLSPRQRLPPFTGGPPPRRRGAAPRLRPPRGRRPRAGRGGLRARPGVRPRPARGLERARRGGPPRGTTPPWPASASPTPSGWPPASPRGTPTSARPCSRWSGPDEAVEELRAALRIDPDLAAARQNLARALLRQGLADAAESRGPLARGPARVPAPARGGARLAGGPRRPRLHGLPVRPLRGRPSAATGAPRSWRRRRTGSTGSACRWSGWAAATRRPAACDRCLALDPGAEACRVSRRGAEACAD